MIKYVRDYVSKLVEKKDLTDNILYLHVFLMTAVSVCALIHLINLILYIILDITPLIILNIVSLIVYYICFILVKKGKYVLSSYIGFFEILVYSFISSYFVGISNFSFLYIYAMLMLLFLSPIKRNRIRIVMPILSFLVLNLIIILEENTHMYQIPENYMRIFVFLNVNIILIVIVLLFFFNNKINDILRSFRQEYLEKLEIDVITDPLTGLYNRRYAKEVFNKLIISKKAYECCFALVDVDDFKKINDNYGHNVGDVVLKNISTLIKSNLREDDKVFRWGGEEIFIIINKVNLVECGKILENLRETIASFSFISDTINIRLSVTIGYSCIINNSIEDTIKKCDEYLYIGKRNGKNQIVC